MSEWRYAEENLILKDEKKNLIAENKRLHDEADYWQQKIDEGKVEIKRLRAALRDVSQLIKRTDIKWMDKKSHISTIAREALRDE